MKHNSDELRKQCSIGEGNINMQHNSDGNMKALAMKNDPF